MTYQDLAPLETALRALPLSDRIGFQTYVYAQGLFQAVESGEFDRKELPSLVSALERLGFNYGELAARFEVSAATIGRWAAGKSLPVQSAMEAIQVMGLEALGDVVVRERNALPAQLRVLLDAAWEAPGEPIEVSGPAAEVEDRPMALGFDAKPRKSKVREDVGDMLNEILARLGRLESRVGVESVALKAHPFGVGGFEVQIEPSMSEAVIIDPARLGQIIEQQPRVK